MKRKPIKQLSVLVISLMLVVSLTACGGAAKGYAPSNSMESEAITYVGQSPMETQTTYAKVADMSESDVMPEEFNTEEYNYIRGNSFLAVKANPFSTFAADVDTASYTNLRRKILSGSNPAADAIRIEEMINYFSYDYPEPQGNEPFSVTTEIAPCPWNADTELLLIGLQAKKLDKDAMPPSNLVFLVDVSGSMYSEDKLPLVQKAFLLLLENMGPEDKISIVTYASSDAVVIKGAGIDEKTKIADAIESLRAGGSTHGSKGINTAYEIAEEYFIEGGNNRVILATDGDLNVGVTSESALTSLVKEKKESGVFLSVMGFGTGNLKDNKMEALADNGNGNYSYIDSLSEARKVLVEEMGGTLFTVAKDVKLQVEFNPAVVKGYRLVGYENRTMAAEDFADDTKDGGEIGAGHRVTALYEIAKVDSAYDMQEVESKYNRPETQNTEQNTENNEWLTLSVRYKEPDGDTSRLLAYPVTDENYNSEMSENMSFAAGVAQFGMYLRNSEYLGTTDISEVIERVEALPSVCEDDYKEELVYIMKKAKRY